MLKRYPIFGSQRLCDLWNRGVEVIQDEGMISFFRKGLLSVTRLLYRKRTLLVFEHDFSQISELKLPRGMQLLIIDHLCGLDDLNAIMTTPSNLNSQKIKNRLRHEALLYCLVENSELAHHSWVGFGRNSEVDPVARHISYKGSAYIGDCVTMPDYRGHGLYSYVLSRICKDLKERGLARALLTVDSDNIPSIRGIGKAGFYQVGEADFTTWIFGSSLEMQ